MAALPHVSIALGMLLCVSGASAQQAADEDFRFPSPHPACVAERGPQVCMDAAHNNYPAERYTPFAALLPGDGYRVREIAQGVAPEVLAECDLLVIVGPIADTNRGDWAFLHVPAFARVELEDLIAWIRASGHLSEHAILRGREESERIDSVVSFAGMAFRASRDWSPLLRFGSESSVSVNLGLNFPDMPRDQWPIIAIPGWSHAAARRMGNGRVVSVGEFTICTALRVGEEQVPLGMNHPAAAQNTQFCLNLVRWLSDVLGD